MLNFHKNLRCLQMKNVMIMGENELELSCKYIFQNETSKHLSAGEQVRNKRM